MKSTTKSAKKPYEAGEVTDKKQPDINARLWMMVNNTGFAIYRARELELSQFNLTMEQAAILHILLENGGSFMITELFTEMHSRPNSIYTLVDRMEKVNLISKEKDPDKNKTIIKISDKGTAIFNSLTSKSLELAFSPLSSEQKKQLATLLVRLTVRTRELLGLPYEPPLQQYLSGNRIAKPPSVLLQSLEDLPDSKMWAIFNTARFTINRARQMELERYDATVEQMMVLDIVNQAEKSVSINDIITETIRQPASVYSLVNRMKAKGLIKIIKPDYSTISSVTASPAGRKLFYAVTTQSLEFIFSILTKQEKEELSTLLGMLSRHVRNILGVNYIPPIFNKI